MDLEDLPSIMSEMYRSQKRASYEPRPVYMARIKLVGKVPFELGFDCEGKKRPYDFIIHFLFEWIFFSREIEELDLFQNRIYEESYRPREGWWRKERI